MKRSHSFWLLGGAILITSAAASFSAVPSAVFVRGDADSVATSSVVMAVKPRAMHIKTPAAVKAVYMTQCVVGTPSMREALVKFVEETELNSIVIDIKDYAGKLAFTPSDETLRDSVSDKCGASDMKEFVASLHEKNIYVIGRITVFQDPYYTKVYPELAVKKLSDKNANWKDHKGLSFIDVSAKPFWDYIVKISEASYEVGFDELNFDYIRYPSDGNMKDIYYSWNSGLSKADALEKFFEYLNSELKDTGVLISADLFGYVTVHLDDLGIGQLLEKALPYFDYIDPMVYPSHYNSGFAGLSNVNSDPYKVVYASMVEAVKRTVATTTQISSQAYERIGTSTPLDPSRAEGSGEHSAMQNVLAALYAKPSYPASKMRPWLQSFDYPVAYTPAMVSAQIKANEDAGLDSYLFWDPANKYTSLKQVLKSNTAAQ